MNPVRPSNETSQALRELPSVHDLLATATLVAAGERFGRDPTREAARHTLQQIREQMQSGELEAVVGDLENLAAKVACMLDKRGQLEMRIVVNATGIILHTGLGRAPLAQEAIHAINQATGYCNVELDLDSGERSQRVNSVADDLCALTGAEAAHVVNNNAGATGLVLAAMARGREVIVSHGELIEIGGGFRLPEVFRAYGARLRAVGTTNRTRLDDYAGVISGETGAVMVIHPSNFRVVGFTESPGLKELVELGTAHNIPVIHDIGSGALVDLATESSAAEPIARDSIRQGADLVLFSGDKLLGGPQCGIIVGKQALIRRLASHPMSRALRVDKLSLAALQATLAIYRRAMSDPLELQSIPFLRLLRTPVEELQQRATQLAERLSAALPGWQVTAIESVSFAGGGSLPGDEQPSRAISLGHPDIAPALLAQKMRIARPAIVGRVHEGQLLLDLRCVMPDEDELIYTGAIQACS
jgi:L-seryl-tRNA(Ser) seleniumtransferase